MSITTEITIVATGSQIVIATEGTLRGPPGPPGPSGGGGFTWNQTVAASIWTIPHNLNRYPSVTVVEPSGDTVVTGVSYIDSNTVRITNASPFAGSAYLN